jgi:MFS family permease
MQNLKSATAQRLYYGWYIAAACSGVAIITWGVGVFNNGVFLGYFVDRYGWTRASLSIGPTLSHLWSGIMGISVGRLIDRRGPRFVLLLGAFAMASGVILLGLTQQPWHTWPAFLLLGSGFACLHTVTLGKIVARWFVRQRARAMAVATFGASLGGTFLVPLNIAILERWGSAASGCALAVITLGIIVPLAIWVMKSGPEVLNLQPDGDAQDNGAPASDSTQADLYAWTVPEALRTRAFWLLALCFSLGMFAQGGFLLHQVMFLQMTLDLRGAAFVVMVTTLMGTVGRVSFAVLGNHWQPRHVAIAVFLLQGISMILSACGQTPWLLTLASAVFGFTMGIVVALQPLLTAACFGQRTFGRIYGPIYFGIRFGAATGPLVFGLMATTSGHYREVFTLSAIGLGLAALGIGWATSPVTHRSAPAGASPASTTIPCRPDTT